MFISVTYITSSVALSFCTQVIFFQILTYSLPSFPYPYVMYPQTNSVMVDFVDDNFPG